MTQEANDKKQLVPMLKEVKVQMGIPPLQATADNGYFSEPNVTDAQLQEIDLFVAPSITASALSSKTSPLGWQ